jgi:hypothetical protein
MGRCPPSPKQTKQKWTGGVAQAVECLLCKVQNFEFKSQSHQKKEEEERRRRKKKKKKKKK